MAKCGAPCEGTETPHEYAEHVEAAARAMTLDPRPVLDAVLRRIEPLVGAERYEDAVVHRDRLRAFLSAAARAQRLRGLAQCPELIAARPDGSGGWEVSVIRHGRLAAAGRAQRGVAVVPFTAALVAGAEAVLPAAGGFPAASGEEAELLLRWLDGEAVRLISVQGSWCTPRHGAAGLESIRVPVSEGEP